MDLVTLVTACALSVEPKLMHALIWHQSGGEPWAVAVQNEGMPRVYSSMQEAISEAHAISIPNDTVRVGLAGLPVSPLKATAAMFLPCRNVAIAAQRIARLADRCKTHPRLKADPTFCGVAVYRGSWQRPDIKFAETVAATVAKADAPNFDMPRDANIELLDIGSETLPPSNDFPLASGPVLEERERGWSRHCSRRTRGNPETSPVTPRMTIQRPSNRRHLTFRVRINRAPRHRSNAYLCQRHRVAGRNDWRARLSQPFAGYRTHDQGRVQRRQPTVSVRRLHMPQILTAFADFQFQGSNSSTRLIGCPSTMRWSTSCRYA
jgi:hypothetical protein